MLDLRHRARPPLIINPNDFSPELKRPPCRGGRDILQNCDLPLPIHHPSRIELGNPGNRGPTRSALVEIDDFLVGVLEREDYGVCRESGEVRMELLRPSD
jgi:hypothetical protein